MPAYLHDKTNAIEKSYEESNIYSIMLYIPPMT